MDKQQPVFVPKQLVLVLKKIRRALERESIDTKDMIMTYLKFSRGLATEEEMKENERMWREEQGDIEEAPAPEAGLRSVGITPGAIGADLGALAPAPGAEIPGVVPGLAPGAAPAAAAGGAGAAAAATPPQI